MLFVVNTLGAEVLYKTVSDWCEGGPDTTVLDVCCGTGTIGLTLAKVHITVSFLTFTN